jgi:hypothetical protein
MRGRLNLCMPGMQAKCSAYQFGRVQDALIRQL